MAGDGAGCAGRAPRAGAAPLLARLLTVLTGEIDALEAAPQEIGGRSAGARKLVSWADAKAAGAKGRIEAIGHPLAAVTEVVAYDIAGTPATFPAGDAVIERALGIEAIRVSPRVRAAGANGVEIEFTAGFAAGEVPENLRLALKRIVAAAYELRAEVPLAQQPGIVPPLARALMAPYWERRI